MLIKVDKFMGQIPLVDNHLLPTNAARVAQDCKLISGALGAFRDVATAWTPTKAGVKKSIYLFGDQYWFHWLDDVDTCRGPIAGDTAERTYFTGDGVPKMTDNAIGLQGGGTDYPTNAYDLGIPTPLVTPTLVVNGTPPTDPSENDSRAYIYTYVSARGEEGPPSTPSAITDVGPDQDVDVNGMSTAPTGNYNIATKRIYRTNAGAYQFVAEVAVATVTYNDTLDGDDLDETLPSANWDMPPDDLFGLTSFPGGVLAGISGNEVCFCHPHQPHAWPVGNRYATEYPPVGLGAFGTTILVTTTGAPYLLTGTDPSAMTSEKIEVKQACASKRGIADLGYAIAYPSPDGLIVIGLGMSKNVTEALFSRDDWQALVPESILGVAHNGKYFLFYDTGTVQGGYIVDPKREDVVPINLYATAAYSDPVTDTLYLQVGDDIVEWEGDTDKLTATWKSKPFEPSRATCPGYGQVKASAYPVTFKMYIDGSSTAKHTEAVADKKPFRLPGEYLATESIEFQIETTEDVQQVLIAESMEAIKRA